ncbi:MAG: bifunctional [glutamine synthetase] adenylyltransferase/[glutamine synthetase]-adenylyl-L-tyrosine phosphorylase, partial [Sciscionella sp.]
TKLGRGGLSDVEWTVQALQLQHAAEHESLRTPATLAALSAARAAGLIDEPNADTLREAWLLATKVRNATMLVRGKPSDQIPLSGRELAAVATICGYGELDDPGGEFLEHYRRSARHARAVVDRVFYGYPD